MTTINTIGRITKDFELKKSDSGCTYANFSIAVNEGVGSKQKTMFFECTIFGADAERLVKAKAKKGSMIQISGKFGVSEFPRNNGEQGYSLKITVLAWAYIPSANGQNTNGNASNNNSNDASSNGSNTQIPNQPPEQHYHEGDYNGTTNLDDEDGAF